MKYLLTTVFYFLIVWATYLNFNWGWFCLAVAIDCYVSYYFTLYQNHIESLQNALDKYTPEEYSEFGSYDDED